MGSMQNVLKAQMATHLLRSGSWTKPTELWFGLFLTIPDKDGNDGVEVPLLDVDTNPTAYGRLSCGPLDSVWSAPDANGDTYNLLNFNYAEPTKDWGQTVGWGIWTAETDGTILLCDQLVQPVNIIYGALPPRFSAGAIKLGWA